MRALRHYTTPSIYRALLVLVSPMHTAVPWPETTPRTDDPVYFNTMSATTQRPYIHRASDN